MTNLLNLSTLLLFTLLPLTGCADSPKSPLEKTNNKESARELSTVEGSITTKALMYEGRDTLGRSCNIYLALNEEHGEHGEESLADDSHLLVKVDYSTLDGHKPHASEGEFYLYDGSTNTYYDKDSNQSNTNPSLLAITLRDHGQEADVNLLSQYLENVELEQYFKIDFSSNTNVTNFKESLEQVLEGESELDDQLNVFDSIQFTTMAFLHNDHYHNPTCLNFKVKEIVETEFDLEGHGHDDEHDEDEHEDHDHD